MDFDEALEHAMTGRAVLFTGAGFSSSGVNLRGTSVKSGPQLARHLSAMAKLPPETALQDAAEEFALAQGEDNLIRELEQEFTAQSVSSAHLQVAKVPWKRVYTTNYDNILETAYSRVLRKLRAVTLSDDIADVPKDETLCIHINGFVGRLNRSTIWSEIKLTDTSFLTESVAGSPWAILFRQDIDAAKVVIFVGYSVGDLDIRRILFEKETLKGKCFFAVGAHPDTMTSRRASRFGTLLNLDLESFARALEKKVKSYVAPETRAPLRHCVRAFEVTQPAGRFSDRYVFDLLLHGDVKSEFVWHALHGGPQYFLTRPATDIALRCIQDGARAVIIHSDLGNGKTLVLEGLKCRALESGFDVYELTTRGDSLMEELEEVFLSSPKTLLFVDNYPDWLDALDYFRDHATKSVSLILSARSAVHDLMVDQLSETLKVGRVPEIDVNQLTKVELDWLIAFFDEYGLWGAKAAWGHDRKLDHLNRVCTAQWHAVLMKLLESPQILSRFRSVLQDLNAKRDYYEILIAIFALAVLGYEPTVDTLLDLCGDRVLEVGFKRNGVIREFVHFATGEVRLRSSVTGEFVLKHIANSNITVDVLIRMARAAEGAARISSFYFGLLKGLMRFSNLQWLLPERDRRRAVIRYYEGLKGLEHCGRNPLFWLQYAIACLVGEDLERAEKYFDTAYSLAEARDYDAYQIDNHYARFLLVRAIRSGDPAQAMAAFRKARKIIFEQIQKERLHYPYRVAAALRELYEVLSPSWSQDDKAEIARAARYIADRIERLPPQRQEQRYVMECWETMQRILEGVGPADAPQS